MPKSSKLNMKVITTLPKEPATKVSDNGLQTAVYRYKTMTKKPAEPDVLAFCLSDIPFMDKIQVLEDVAGDMYEDTKSMEWLEVQLEKADQKDLAQYMRFWMNYAAGDDKPELNRWCKNMIETDIKSRWLAQRMNYLREHVDDLREVVRWKSPIVGKEPSTDYKKGKKQVLDWECEISEFGSRYWKSKMRIWKLECDIPSLLLRRSFSALRENPTWYLSNWLRTDCVRRGGCCGRDCDCCEKPRGRGSSQSHGHCTTACGCCIRSHGCAAPDKFNDLKEFPIEKRENITGYTDCALRAYIWGVDFLNNLCRREGIWAEKWSDAALNAVR